MPKKRSTRSLDPALGQIYERVNPKLDERERLQELFRILLEEKIASLGDDVPESHKKAGTQTDANGDGDEMRHTALCLTISTRSSRIGNA